MENKIYMLNSVTNIQMNSFIITTAEGGVIVMDGGFRQDAENMLTYLRNITGQEIPNVDAWFFSHAHLDHISCFNEIVENHWDKLTVDHIYYNFPSVQYCAREDRGYDRAVEEFMANRPRFADKVITVYGYDAYDVGGAHIDVLYSPNCEIQCNFVNNSSVILMLTLGGKKVLFLGDAGIEEGERLLALYGENGGLKADYVQMAHHGQCGVEKNVYDAIAPTGCLWCTPDWLWNNDAGLGYNTHTFKTIIVQGWMEELGVAEHYIMMNGTQIIDL